MELCKVSLKRAMTKSTSHKFELISFDLCPFVQRSVITLLEKDIEFVRINIDLANKPAWFLKLSPLGKVPVLRINQQILFESSVINEYLDEITPPSLHPSAPFLKARNRAWIEFGSDLFTRAFKLLTMNDENSMMENATAIRNRFQILESNLQMGPFFNGDGFSLVDAAFAPLFIRLHYLVQPHLPTDVLSGCTKIKQWSENLLGKASVRGSIIPDFIELATNRYRAMGSYLLRC